MSNSKGWLGIPPAIVYISIIISTVWGIAKHIVNENAIKICDVYSEAFAKGNNHVKYLAITESILIAILMLVLYSNLNKIELKLTKNDIQKYQNKIQLTEEAVVFFYKLLLILCASWLVLYLWFAFSWSFGEPLFHEHQRLVFWIFADLIHSSAAFIFFYIYVYVETPFPSKRSSVLQDSNLSRLITLGAITLTILIISVIGRVGIWNLNRIGPICLAFWVGISMQYFMSILETLDARVNRKYFTPLYLYVLVQTLWPVIGSFLNLEESTLILYITFILKIYFMVVFIIWLRRNYFTRYFFNKSKGV